AQAILNGAAASAGLGRDAEALASLAEARRLFDEEGSRVWVACADLQVAMILYRQGRLEECMVTAGACAALFHASGLRLRAAQANLLAARAALALARYDEATPLVSEVLALGQAQDIPFLTYQAHHLTAALAAARGDSEQALDSYDHAIAELERLRGRLMVEWRADFLKDKQDSYESALLLALDLDQPSRALDYAERAKSRALLDLLAYRLDLGIESREETDRPLVEELVRLRAERDRLVRRWEGQGATREGTPDPGEGQPVAQQEILALEKQITGLWHRLLIHNASYARDAALWQVRAEPVQPYLAADTLLIEYFIARGELVVFLVTRGSIEARRLPGVLPAVQQASRLLWLNFRAMPARLRRNSAAALLPNARGLLQQLHTLLVTPLADALSAYPRLLIVPHGSLHYLPFHAFHDGEHYLLEQHEIGYLPGASFLRYTQEAQPNASGLAAFGHSRGRLLPHALHEATTVAALMGGDAFLEEEASLAQVRRAAANCRVLHLATHGDFRPDNPLFSGLALADGWLTTLEIFSLRINASLVTLSACQTGRNVVAGGDELLGLMRAFLYAGAVSLVLSLWPVEDLATARLMQSFYRNLAAGAHKGAALRDAQLQFVRGQSGVEDVTELHAHPYFWAPFLLIGDGGPL
nr:CHAT domain-containing protein [Geodermatophilaceae bacterium]